MLRLQVAAVFLSASIALGQSTPAPQPGDEADKLFRNGKFSQALDSYKSALKLAPEDIHAQAGMISSLLHLNRPDEAYELLTHAMAANPQSPELLSVKGDVHFRRAEMNEAERSWQAAFRADHKQAHALLGLARLYEAYSLNRKAYELLKGAHEIAPDDPEIQRAWFGELPRKERLAALEAYMAGAHPDDAEETQFLEHALAYLRATVDKPPHRCRLTSKVDKTTTKLEALRQEPHHIDGYALMVAMNGHNSKLELDTGASGITIGSRIARQAGLTRISETSIGGIGDKGEQSGYIAVADTIKIGELEFHDCVVDVSDRRSVIDLDGLIGADVFASYLIDIDIPGQHLLLSPLPKRPDEAEADKSLNTAGSSGSTSEESSLPTPEQSTEASAKPVNRNLPKDRYVAPEMKEWSPIFHFGHLLLFPTFVNDSQKPSLFLLDTGAWANTLSMKAARQYGKPYEDPYLRVKGLSGEVKKVYRVDRIRLQFGRFVAPPQSYTAFDISNLAQHTGTEVSGTLGFDMLRMLEVKIDYRDGLVDFRYDPKRVMPFE